MRDQYEEMGLNLGRRWLVLAVAVILAVVGQGADAEEGAKLRLAPLDPPTGLNAREPALAAFPDGRAVLSWTEGGTTEAAVRMAIFEGGAWSEARTVHRSAKMFVNWADFPSVVVLSDGTLAAHWLALNGPGRYAYDVMMAFSADEGRSWTTPVSLHEDRSPREHGFVSLVPDAEGGLTALWLDGRSYDGASDDVGFGNAMQVRARQMRPDGTMGPESLLDARACTCCQTAAVRNGDGEIVAAYRDRSGEEIRDISVVRLTAQGWTAPVTVHDDGWEIAGCPVNGPAVDAMGREAALVWFTGAAREARVRIAFSGDGGESFAAPLDLSLGAAAGRVDVGLLGDGTALALWVETVDGNEAIVLCRVSQQDGCQAPLVAHVNRGRGSVGFPRMVRAGERHLLAWTGSVEGRDATTIRMLEVTGLP